uniref:Adhesion G protein-coupled receptor A3-like isoform X1 n=2 Tax=Petromyzon marinus TaxID=7757 RepID=A0AAJ7SW60_PETMA|nr:adhesion G protein-coupled receptor A3-like isoform X1 [Petromyzon marinus]
MATRTERGADSSSRGRTPDTACGCGFGGFGGGGGGAAALTLALLLLLVTPWLGAAPGALACSELAVDECSCGEERAKGPARHAAARRVTCSSGSLGEVLPPGVLPSRTVTLILSNNRISQLKNGSFYGLNYLERLDLKNNLISTIEPGAFLGLSELKRLDLSNNRIGCLSSETFVGLASLTRLNLSGNIFNTIPQGTLDVLQGLKFLEFESEWLLCDCGLRWLPGHLRNRSVRLSEPTRCPYPRALRGLPLRALQETQLSCDGPLELPTLQLIPSSNQVVFRGDRLPLQCTATWVDASTTMEWRLDGHLVGAVVDGAAVLLENSTVHDCTLISSGLMLPDVSVGMSGRWECVVSTARGNASRAVDIIVLENSSLHCPAERLLNNKGDFRWPRTLAGITATLPCPHHQPLASVGLAGSAVSAGGGGSSGGGGPGAQVASRRCDRTGQWVDGDHSSCQYANEHTRLLHTFTQMPVNATTAPTLAQQLLPCISEAPGLADKMDVVFVAQMLERFTAFSDRNRELGELIVDMASAAMGADEAVLGAAQAEARACSRIVASVERFARQALLGGAQDFNKFSANIAMTALRIKPSSFSGITCTAFRKTASYDRLAVTAPRDSAGREAVAFAADGGGASGSYSGSGGFDQQLSFKCNAGNLTHSLLHFPGKNTVAEASVQLPPTLLGGPAGPGTGWGSRAPAPLPGSPGDNTCLLQLVVFRNGRLFPPAGNASDAADAGRRRAVVTPVLYLNIDGLGADDLVDWVAVSLRRFSPGTDPVAALWDPEARGGRGAWGLQGCRPDGSEGNVTTLRCGRLGNYAVLMDVVAAGAGEQAAVRLLHPAVYVCSALLLLCLLALIATYVLHHRVIRVGHKSWHMLLSLWLHLALATAIFAGGINRTQPAVVCQAVGIALHYASLASLLWLGILARNLCKQLRGWRAPPQPGDAAPGPQPRPMLRFYLIGGGIPIIICGITAAANIKNYGSTDSSPYCWMAWEPSLGAFYGPAAFVTAVACIYFSCALARLRRMRSRCKREALKESQAVGGATTALATAVANGRDDDNNEEEKERGGRGLVGPVSLPEQALARPEATDSASASQAEAPAEAPEDELPPGARLAGLAGTFLAATAAWAFGALAVARRDGRVESHAYAALYAASATALGLFLLAHHGARRRDVWQRWRARCPRRAPGRDYTLQLGPGSRLPSGTSLTVNGSGPATGCGSGDSSVAEKSHSTATNGGKLTNLQVARSRGLAPMAPLPCDANSLTEHSIDRDLNMHVVPVECAMAAAATAAASAAVQGGQHRASGNGHVGRHSGARSGGGSRSRTGGNSGGGGGSSLPHGQQQTQAQKQRASRLAVLREYAYDVPTSVDGEESSDRAAVGGAALAAGSDQDSRCGNGSATAALEAAAVAPVARATAPTPASLASHGRSRRCRLKTRARARASSEALQATGVDARPGAAATGLSQQESSDNASTLPCRSSDEGSGRSGQLAEWPLRSPSSTEAVDRALGGGGGGGLATASDRTITIELGTRERRSHGLNLASQNGALQGSRQSIGLLSSDSMASVRTGHWKNETTV